MFYLMTNYLTDVLKPTTIRWHYTEQGHGKGAPDGDGGCLKRNADRLVGTGKDIINTESFYKELTAYCPSVKLFVVSREDIEVIDKILPNEALDPFGGTLKVHEITWTKTNLELHARELTC